MFKKAFLFGIALIAAGLAGSAQAHGPAVWNNLELTYIANGGDNR